MRFAEKKDYIEIQSTYEMFIAQTRVCGNPWDSTIYNTVHLEECWMRKIEKNIPRVTPRPPEQRRVLRASENSCVRKID